MEHPHSAIIRSPQPDGTRKQSLVTPGGNLHGVFQATADGFAVNSGYARRGTQLATLATHLEDLVAVALPYEGVPALLSTPYARLRREYIDPSLTDAILDDGEGRKCRKALERLFEDEIRLALRDQPEQLVLEERVTEALLAHPLWLRHLNRATRLLTRSAPNCRLFMTVSLAQGSLKASLPEPWQPLYLAKAEDEERQKMLEGLPFIVLNP